MLSFLIFAHDPISLAETGLYNFSILVFFWISFLLLFLDSLCYLGMEFLRSEIVALVGACDLVECIEFEL